MPCCFSAVIALCDGHCLSAKSNGVKCQAITIPSINSVNIALFLVLESCADGQQQPSAVRNLDEVRQSVIREFFASCRTSRLCTHCHSSVRPLRQESHVKILHGRTPSSRLIKNLLVEKIKLATFCICCC